MTTTPTDINPATISANLVALQARLKHGLAMVSKASQAMTAGEQNQAIGTIIDLERILPECDALYRTIILLHRSPSLALVDGGAS